MTKPSRALIQRLNHAFLSIPLWGLLLLAALASYSRAEQFPPDPLIHSRLDWTSAMPIRELPIFHQDFTLRLDSGQFVPFLPVKIGEQIGPLGGLFIGHGRFQFYPSVAMEKGRLTHFFGVDSLNRVFEKAIIFLDPRILRQISSAAQSLPERSRELLLLEQRDSLDLQTADFLARLASPERASLLAELCNSRLVPSAERYLHVAALFPDQELVSYRFDPMAGEEVQLLRETTIPSGLRGMELICRYSMFVDADYFLLNGVRKPILEPIRYQIDATISNRDTLTVRTILRATVMQPGGSIVPLRLATQFVVASVRVGELPCPFFLDSTTRMSERELLLLLPATTSFLDTIAIEIVSGGPLVAPGKKEKYPDVAAGWYPRYGYTDPARYDLTFNSPKKKQLFVSARLVSDTTIANSRQSRWRLDTPAPHVSFSYGSFKLIKPAPDEQPHITIAYVPAMHRSLLPAEVPADEAAVVHDLKSAMQFFSERFGAYPFPNLNVVELHAWHGRSYPGHLQLAHQTFIGDDIDGANELFRAHELAHQWWGTSVWLESYHDEWLSEGFSEYAALLHLKHRRGDELFHSWLQQYFRDIAHIHTYYSARGTSAAPIALGYRAGSTLDSDAHDLIVYRKGAFVLHMIRMMLTDLTTGDDSRFFELMAEFFRRYQGQRVNSRDFKFMAETYVGIDLTSFFEQWVYGSLLPHYQVASSVSALPEGGWELRMQIKQEHVPEQFEMWVPIILEFEDKQLKAFRVLVNRPETIYSLTLSQSKPKKIIFNPNFAVLGTVDQTVEWNEK